MPDPGAILVVDLEHSRTNDKSQRSGRMVGFEWGRGVARYFLSIPAVSAKDPTLRAGCGESNKGRQIQPWLSLSQGPARGGWETWSAKTRTGAGEGKKRASTDEVMVGEDF
jgi:hypothetical protein